MGRLDRPEALAVDSLGLIPGVGEAVQAFDRGRASAEALEIPFPPDAIRDVAICGMGGSAIAGELEDGRAALDTAVAAYGPHVAEEENPAKQLASALLGSVPVVYGAEATAALAYRWKCQFNENSKVPCFWHAFPEMNHNEIVGYEGMGEFQTLAHVLMLRD